MQYGILYLKGLALVNNNYSKLIITIIVNVILKINDNFNSYSTFYYY
jgi:hypothetical protein